MPRSILVVDDHEVIRRQLRLLFNSYPEFTVCGEAVHGGIGLAAYGIGNRMAAHGLHHIDERIMRRVADMLLSNDPKILDKGVVQLAHNPKILNWIKSIEDRITRLPGQIAKGGVAGGTAQFFGNPAQGGNPSLGQTP